VGEALLEAGGCIENAVAGYADDVRFAGVRRDRVSSASAGVDHRAACRLPRERDQGGENARLLGGRAGA
jgi:hypothetical protein